MVFICINIQIIPFFFCLRGFFVRELQLVQLVLYRLFAYFFRQTDFFPSTPVRGLDCFFQQSCQGIICQSFVFFDSHHLIDQIFSFAGAFLLEYRLLKRHCSK